MRPRGDIRSLFAATAYRMVEPGGAVTWRAVAEETQIGWDIAQATMENMVRSGEWERVGSEKRAGSNNWHGLYAPVSESVEESNDYLAAASK